MSLRGNTTPKTIVKGLAACAKEFHWVFIIRVCETEKKATLTLTQRETMRKLNDARGQLKHKGVIPSKSVIDSAYRDVTNFFLENTLSLFQIQFESISMANFVKCEP